MRGDKLKEREKQITKMGDGHTTQTTMTINFCVLLSQFKNVPEVLKVHVNESFKKSTFFKSFFFQAVKN